jgi:signal transduction histidine kinase
MPDRTGDLDRADILDPSRRQAVIVDALLGFAVFAVVAIAIGAGIGGGDRSPAVAYGFAVVFGLLMLVRRTWPMAVLLVTSLLLIAYYVVDLPVIGLAIPVAAALYSAASYGRTPWVVAAAAALVVVSTVARVLEGQDIAFLLGYELASTAAVMGAAIALGDGARQRREASLQRARIAAQRESVVFRTPVRPVMERMTRVVQKLGPDQQVFLALPDAEVIFAGEREDLEEITGNLLENAMKWSRGEVRVTIGVPEEDDAALPHFTLAVEDDGTGIPEGAAREALKRGRRLDETKPGTGLGLAIVSDLVKEYNGRLELGRSDLGGLKALVTLRRMVS